MRKGVGFPSFRRDGECVIRENSAGNLFGVSEIMIVTCRNATISFEGGRIVGMGVLVSNLTRSERG